AGGADNADRGGDVAASIRVGAGGGRPAGDGGRGGCALVGAGAWPVTPGTYLGVGAGRDIARRARCPAGRDRAVTGCRAARATRPARAVASRPRPRPDTRFESSLVSMSA